MDFKLFVLMTEVMQMMEMDKLIKANDGDKKYSKDDVIKMNIDAFSRVKNKIDDMTSAMEQGKTPEQYTAEAMAKEAMMHDDNEDVKSSNNFVDKLFDTLEKGDKCYMKEPIKEKKE